ncbi:MAG: helix-turn-helix transcriptional regulator [Gammaproteobacteria bacterium]|nr:helix-turn-helix transcriptional regulator [Gammaproteobacteria bacterium]NNL49634.1 helix-turn-helix transcriptional regulator [Woeseiaceae bacterium]
MTTRFDKPEWHTALAGLVKTSDDQGTAQALVKVLGVAVEHNATCLLAFYGNAAPDVLHHTMSPRRARHYLDRYLAGPYLLDPLYQLAVRAKKPSICRCRDESPDRFRSSEYYRQYYERTHLADEMDFLWDADANTTLVLVVGRWETRFSRAEVARLRVMEPVVQAAMQRIWGSWAARHSDEDRDLSMHQRLTQCFERFGESSLTQRERQITQLLLRGHSSKSIARELNIAPGTVMVHKRNLFSKLGITSQYELFSLFIDKLSML